MGKKAVTYTLILTLLFTMMSFSLSYADDEADVSQQQAELDGINQQREALTKEINSGKAVVNSLNKEIKNLESKIAMSQLEMQELSGSILKTQDQIDQALADLDQLEADIALQNEALNGRLRAMYKNGSIGFLDVLLGSSSMSDLMTNLDRIERVFESDKQVLKALETQHQQIEAQRTYLLGLQASLQNSKDEEAARKAELDTDKGEVDEKKKLAASDLKALEEQEDALVAEANAIKSEILKLQGTGDYIGGSMLWPAPGVSRITSQFGYRIHPILKTKKLHTGLDIGTPRNTTIVAANAGTVMKAGWNNSYGNMVMIDHGGGIVTLYAHNSTLLVKVGQTVAMGDAIAKAGSTGMSTGPHLHFEVRVNGEYKDPEGYVKY